MTVASGRSRTSDDTALRTTTGVTIDGGGGLTINLASPTPRRTFTCTGKLNLQNLTLSGGDTRGVSMMVARSGAMAR